MKLFKKILNQQVNFKKQKDKLIHYMDPEKSNKFYWLEFYKIKIIVKITQNKIKYNNKITKFQMLKNFNQYCNIFKLKKLKFICLKICRFH